MQQAAGSNRYRGALERVFRKHVRTPGIESSGWFTKAGTAISTALPTGGFSGFHLLYIPVSRDMLLPRLSEGYGDLIATMMVTTDRPQFAVDFTDPLYDNARAVIVSGPEAQRQTADSTDRRARGLTAG
jgi:ABC-type amino acid transport substrate-binding protein